VANQLGRKFIGIDNSYEAITNILKRFRHGLEEMGDFVNDNKTNLKDQGLFVFSPGNSYDSDNTQIVIFLFFVMIDILTYPTIW
jgi:hypothetical protein